MMHRIMSLTLALSFCSINCLQTQASSLSDFCAEFATNQVSRNITINYLDNSGNFRVLNTVSELFNWCLDNLNAYNTTNSISMAGSINISTMPELKIASTSTGWEVYGVPIANIAVGAVGTVSTAVLAYTAYKQYQSDRKHANHTSEITLLKDKIERLERSLMSQSSSKDE